MLSKLLVLANILLVLSFSLECNLENVQESKNMCIETNIQVYQEVNNNGWQNWLDIITDLATEIHPFVGIVSFGTRILGGLTGSSSNADLAFQQAVNEEINRLRRCIDQVTIDETVNTLRNTLFNTIEPEYQDLKDITDLSILDSEVDKNYDDIQNLISTHFDMQPGTVTPSLQRFTQYLPIYEAVLIIYDKIISGYLVYLLFNNDMSRYQHILSDGLEKATILQNWILMAQQDIKTSYTPSNPPALSAIDFEVKTGCGPRGCAHEHTGFTWNSFMIGDIDDNMSGSGTLKNMDLSITVGDTTLNCDTPGTLQCDLPYRGGGSVSLDPCRTKIRNKALGEINGIKDEITIWDNDFDDKYIKPIQVFLDKLADADTTLSPSMGPTVAPITQEPTQAPTPLPVSTPNPVPTQDFGACNQVIANADECITNGDCEGDLKCYDRTLPNGDFHQVIDGDICDPFCTCYCLDL